MLLRGRLGRFLANERGAESGKDGAGGSSLFEKMAAGVHGLGKKFLFRFIVWRDGHKFGVVESCARAATVLMPDDAANASSPGRVEGA